MLVLAGLAALVVLAGFDAFGPGWDPEPWSYGGAVIVLVWGPTALPSLAEFFKRR